MPRPRTSVMLQEIAEQPEALARTLQLERKNILQFGKFIASRDIRLIVLVGRGSSDNAALFGKYLLEISSGIPVSLAAPSVHTRYHTKLKMKNALVIGISQSGEGTDINYVLESSRKAGAYTVGIMNTSNSSMSKIVHETFLIRAGQERSVAATKTYTCQLLLLYLVACALQSGRGADRLNRIPELVSETLRLSTQVESIVERYRFMNRCVVVGRGLNYANAYELAIKLMETCYVVSDRFSSADFQHGPVAMIEKDFPVFVFAPPGKTYGNLYTLARQLHRLGAETLVISSESPILKWSTRSIRIPQKIAELLSPIPYIIPGQLFAAYLSEVKGLNPDRPRSLHKVTQTI
ncbi:MAG: SIS domain-containing protein [Terriglobia bacterium]